jgi:N-acetylglucosamine malate deacetylase 1
MSIRKFIRSMGFHPRRWWDAVLTYPRYLGVIKPKLMASSESEFNARCSALGKAWWPKALTVPVGKRILAFSPHPDDESIGAGGLLWSHRDLSELHLVVACKGDGGGELESGPWQDDSGYKERLVAQRRDEISKVSDMLRAKSLKFLGNSDGKIDLSRESRDKLRLVMEEIKPDVVLLPWFLDNLKDHRMLNILFASACGDFRCVVLAYEVWTMLQPNAFLDISDHLEGKLALIRNYASQLRTVNYLSYAEGIARSRAFHCPVREKRDGAVEAYLALPNNEYCELVTSFYGTADAIKPEVRDLLGMK